MALGSALPIYDVLSMKIRMFTAEQSYEFPHSEHNEVEINCISKVKPNIKHKKKGHKALYYYYNKVYFLTNCLTTLTEDDDMCTW